MATMTGEYLAHRTVSEAQISEWVEQFHRDGYLFLKSVLTPEMCAELRADLDRALAEDQPPAKGNTVVLHHRMFEISPANLRLFDLEPIVSLRAMRGSHWLPSITLGGGAPNRCEPGIVSVPSGCSAVTSVR